MVLNVADEKTARLYRRLRNTFAPRPVESPKHTKKAKREKKDDEDDRNLLARSVHLQKEKN